MIRPFRVPRLVACVLAVALPLAGCSVFGSEEEETAAEPGPAVVERGPVQVQAVRRLELGRTRDGIVITAFGTAPGIGYAGPRLEPRREGAPASDGLIDYDFVAVPPDPGFGLPTGRASAREIRADRFVSLDELQGSRGIRVHGRDRSVRVLF